MMKKQQEKKSFLRKLARIFVLLGIKESYLFIRNSLGLIVHPFKTLRVIQREKDRSQQLLFFCWPVLGFVIGIIFGWLILIFVSLFLFGYLSYWFIRVWRVDENNKRRI